MSSFPVSRINSRDRHLLSLRLGGVVWVLVIALLYLSGCAAQPGFYHTVEPGQTLYRIGRAYQVDERHLARINGIDDPTSLRVGQRLYIPETTRAVAVPVAKPVPAPSVPTAKATEGPSIPPKVASEPSPKPVGKSAPATKTVPSDSAEKPPTPRPPDKGRFQWPLKGPLIRGFGSNGGVLSKGIEISCPAGSAVHSAGAGRVIYSSNGVAGYGNLIIIRHDDGFFSVYGFNKKNLVTVGTFVSRGQRIALSGTPPGGGSPRLHFEIRNGKDAVNPIFYLP